MHVHVDVRKSIERALMLAEHSGQSSLTLRGLFPAELSGRAVWGLQQAEDRAEHGLFVLPLMGVGWDRVLLRRIYAG